MAKGFNLTAEINLRGPSNLRQVASNIRKQLGNINANVNVQINQQTAKQISIANKSFSQFNKTLKQTQTIASSTSKSLSQLANSAGKLSSNLQKVPAQIASAAQGANQISQSNQKAAQATNALTSEFAEFGRQSALAVRRFAAFATVTGVIYKVSNAVTSATKDFLDFEKELIKVAQVSRTPVAQLDFLTKNITKLSTNLGVASKDLVGVSRTLAQAGLSANDTSKALQALARSALAPTFDDMNRTVEGSIALMRQFSIGANQLEGALGSINAVAGKFAVEAGDIITAISRAGGVFASASKGVSEGTDALNEFIAVFTSVRATTRESAETIATGLRTIFTRIQRSDTIDSLKAFGITLTDLEGKFVGPYKAIQLLSQGLRTLDPRDLRFGRIVEELGGFRQIGKVIPLIQQFTTAQRALNVAQQGTGSLARDAAVAQQSLANQIQKVNEQFTAFIRSVAGSSGFKDLTRSVLDISSALISVADAAKGALPALTAIFAIKGFKALTQFGGGFLGGIKRGAGNTLNTGGYVKGYARGGMVPGTGNRDTVPAMLTPGEFVIKKSSVSKLGTSTLAAMNENRFSQKSRGPGAGNVRAKKKKGIAEYKLSHTVGQLAAYGDDGSLGPKPAKTGAFTLGQLAKKYNVADAKKRIKSGQSPQAPTRVTGNVVNLKLGEESGKAFGGDEWLNPGLAEIDKKVNQGLRKLKLKGSKSPLSKDEAVRQKIEGFTLESFISGLLGKSAEGGSEAFDFKNIDTKALSDLSFRGKPPKYLDSKRTLIGRSEIIKKGVDDADVKLRAMATGGSIEDTVPALLTPGEFVINKKSAARLGPSKLHALNKGQRVRGYNKGGFVQSFSNGGGVSGLSSDINQSLGLKGVGQVNSALAGIPGAIQKLLGAVDRFGAGVISADPKMAAGQVKAYARALGRGATESQALTAAIDAGEAATRQYSTSSAKASKHLQAQSSGLTSTRAGTSAGQADTRTASSIVQQRVAAGGMGRSGNDMARLARESDLAAAKLKAQFRPEAAGKALTVFKGALLKTNSPILAMRAAVQQGINTTKQLNASTRKFSMSLSNISASMPTLGPMFAKLGTGIQGAVGKLKGLDLSSIGTTLAFAGPMLADQIGQGIGGTTGAGIAGAATGMSTAVAVGSQFGPYGALVGAIAGTVMAIDGYTSAVAQKEVEIANTKIDQAVESNQKSLEKLSKNINNVAARRESTRNIQAIRQAEIDKAAASERAAQPGLMSRGLNFVSGGYLGGDSRTSEDRIGARVSTNQAGAQASQSRIDAELAAGKSLKELDEQLRKNGGSLRNLYTDIVEADSSYQEEVQVIQEKNMAESLKTKAINDLKKKYVGQVATGFQAQQAEIDKAKAAKKLATAMRVQTASLTRTFSNLNQSIQASSDSLQNASQELQNIVSGATGFTANLDSLSVLNNPAAFGRSEQNNAIRQGSQFAGQDAAFMQQLARFSLDADQIIASGAARAQRSGSSGDRVNIAKDTVNRLTKRLEDALGSNQLTNGIRNQLIASIDDAVKNGDDIDLQKLIEESGLSQSLDASKQVFDALKNSAQFLENAMNFAAKGANEYSKQTQLLRDNQARYQQIILQSGLSLKKALGQRVGVRETIDARTRTAATKAGVSADQFSAQNLVQRREGLQKEADRIKKSLNKLAQSSDNASTSASKAFLGLTKKLGDTESKLKAVDNAIQNLPGTIEANINDVIGEIGRIVQEQQALQQAGGQFAEQLVGSTPQELANLSSSFNILERTLAGQSNTIQQSQAAQMAYYQALQNGSTQQEAYNAAQQAFAGQTQSALSLFNQLSQMSGLEGPEINSIRADLLEGFARSQGMGVENSPIFKTIIDNLRADTGESPEVVELKKIHRVLQQDLAGATGAVEGGILDKQNNILQATTTHFLNELKNVQLNFNQAQVNLISAGIGRPGRTTGAKPLKRSQGGVVYASEGAYVNYQPRGTDTIPAMLTPGEFVVNAKASKKNAGLLTAINNSAGTGKTFSSGGVVYAKRGVGPDFSITDDGMELVYGGEHLGMVPSHSLDPSLRRSDAMDSMYSVGTNAKRRSGAHVAGGRSAKPTKPRGRMRFSGGNIPRPSAGTISRIGVQQGLSYGLNYAGVSDQNSAALGMAGDAGVSMYRAGAGGRMAAGSSTLGLNAGFDAVYTAGEFIYDREGFHNKKLQQSEENVTAGEGFMMGLTRPVDTITRGAYTSTSAYQARQQRIDTEKSTAAMQRGTPGTGGNWYTSGFGPAGKTYVEQMSDLILEEQKVLQDKALTEQQKNEHLARIKTMKAGLPKISHQDIGYAGGSQKAGLFSSESHYSQQEVDKLVDERVTAAVGHKQKRARFASSPNPQLREYLDSRAAQYGLPPGSTREEISAASSAAWDKKHEANAQRQRHAQSLGLSKFATQEQIEAKEKANNQKDLDERRVAYYNDRSQNMLDSRGVPYEGGDDIAFLSHVSEELPSINALDPKDRALYEEGKRRSAEIDSIKNEKWDPNGFHLGGITTELEWTRDRDRRLKQAYKNREKIVVKPLTDSFKNKGYDDPATLASHKNAYYDGKEAEKRRRERVTKQRQRDHEKGRDPRTFQRYNGVANNFDNMNPRQQQIARANLGKGLHKYGVYDPSLSQDENIDRMHNAGIGHLAPVMYPGAQTQRKGLRVKSIRSNQQAQTQQRQRRPSPRSKESRKGFFQSIYASEGMLVPYEPRGTDTVPAMLTPGEFVINKAATQKHKPLLESINRSKGGSVSYLADGGNVSTGRMVDGMDVERENPLLKKMDENIAKTTQAGNIAAAGRNFSQQGLTNIKDGNQVYNDDRNQGTPANIASMKDLANHVTHEHQKTRKLVVGLKLIDDVEFSNFMLGAAGAPQGQPGLGIPGFVGGQPKSAGGLDPVDLLNRLGIRSGGFSKGGVVYASEGKYVNYEPKGTDTIPAMLTPGEFVVNAKASKQNAALLSAINSGAMNKGGIVYAQDGKYVTRVVMGEGDRFRSFVPGTGIESDALAEETRESASRNTNQYIGNVDAFIKMPTQVKPESMLYEIQTNYKNHPSHFKPGYYQGVYEEAVRTKHLNDPNYAQRMLTQMIERRESWKNLINEFGGVDSTVLDEKVGGRTVGEMASTQLKELDNVIPKMATDLKLFQRGEFTEEEVNNAKLMKMPQEKRRGGVVYAQGGILGDGFAGGIPNKMQRKAFNLNQDLQLESMMTPMKSIRQYGFSPNEKMFDNIYENLQDFMGGNKFPPRELRAYRDIPGNISNLMDSMYAPFHPSLDPKKGLRGWQGNMNEKAVKTIGEHDPSIYHNKGGIIYARDGFLGQRSGNNPGTSGAGNAQGEKQQLENYIRFIQQRNAIIAEINAARMVPRVGRAGYDGMSMLPLTPLQKERMQEKFEAANAKLKKLQMPNNTFLRNQNDVPPQRMFARIQALAKKHGMTLPIAAPFPKVENFQFEDPYGELPSAIGPRGINVKGGKLKPPGPPKPNANPRVYPFSKGGPVYASNGMLIPYRPQGTDTVPAMLTPGEFVVNKTATQQHLPALQAMNQGGRVAYLSNGTPGSDVLLKEFNKLASAVAPVASNFENLLSGLQNLTNNGGGGVSTSSIGSDALSAFGQIFSNFINSVNAISLPESINVRMEPTSVNVKISGTEALGALEEKMQSIIQTKLTTEINQRIENYLSTRE